ncbi:hypothetical protein EDB84DRAFT_1674179, partial [Lactarius hengduanensis]
MCDAPVLCNPELDPIVEHVLVEQQSGPFDISCALYGCVYAAPGLLLTAMIFCPPENKLRIVNSAENKYRARFLGCSRSHSEYCFVQMLQDDDYLILPIIHALHGRATELRPVVHLLVLLPPHERLSSDLRVVYAGNRIKALHTSFLWLEHGTMMHRSLASEFLLLLQFLNHSNEEVKMADNYFAVLKNHPPETWVVVARSRGRAAGHSPLLRGWQRAWVGLAYSKPLFLYFRMRLNTLANVLKPDMLDVEERNLRIPGDKLAHYSFYPPSFAVDGRPDTAFRSPR